jgi:hypothetical protein
MIFKIDEEEYKRSVDYEVLQECINLEASHHTAELYKVWENSEQGRMHIDARKALIKLRDSLNPYDESTVINAWIVLDALKTKYTQAANLAKTVA